VRSALLVIAACDPGYRIDATISGPPEAIGKPLVVFEYGSAHLDPGAVLPTPNRDWSFAVAFAGVPEAFPINVTDAYLGCPDAMYMAAWTDVDDSQGIGALLAGRTLTIVDYDHSATLLDQIATHAPEPGDLVGIGGPVDFGMDFATCKHARLAMTIDLR
jgi:hypothetical protein